MAKTKAPRAPAWQSKPQGTFASRRLFVPQLRSVAQASPVHRLRNRRPGLKDDGMKRSRKDNVNRIVSFRKGKKPSGRIVIIAPHPDDETLGASNLILAARRRGLDVAFIMLTGGEASHPNSRLWPGPRLARLRSQELRRALGRLGLLQPMIRHMGWQDGQLAKQGNALALRAMLRSLEAHTVLVTSPDDHHPDHKAAFRIAKSALHGSNISLWTYAVWSRLSHRARRAINRDHARQYWAVKAHRSQVSDYISDDPAGFTFSADLLDQLLASREIYGCM